MSGYYVLKTGLSEGPISYDEVLRRFQSGEYAAEMLFWCAEQPDWQPLSALLAPKPVPGLPPLPDGSLPVARPMVPPPQAPVAPPIVQSGTKGVGGDATTPRPWRRYFARNADLWAIGIPCYVLFTIPVYMMSTDIPDVEKFLSNQWVVGIIATGLTVPMCAFFLSATGTTPGKWLYGIRVLGKSGERLSFDQAMKRELGVYATGMGFGIPIVNTASAYLSSRTLRKKGSTVWDDRVGSEVICAPASFRLFVTICLSFVLIASVIAVLAVVGDHAK